VPARYNAPMSTNIEVKARVHDFHALRGRAERLSDEPAQVIAQEDTFFKIGAGRLKLRQFTPQSGELIFYRRDDSQGPRSSDYAISETSDPEGLRLLLAQAMGIRGRVKKTRLLYVVGQTRVHLDDVEGLGQFMELEVVMRQGQTDDEGKAIAHHLMQQLGIRQSDLVSHAYIDLLEARPASRDISRED
jgi:adenylate cyclase class IV